MDHFWNQTFRYPCRFFWRLLSRFFLPQCCLTARCFKLRANRTQTKASLFILLDSECSLSHCCSTESWSFHTAKTLRLEKFITATQSTIAKNDAGFPTANSSPSFRLVKKLAIQEGLNPIIHGAERYSRNWSEWKQKVEGNSETQFRFASATQMSMLADLWSKPTSFNSAQNKLAREASQSWLVLKVREQTDIIRSLSTLLNN